MRAALRELAHRLAATARLAIGIPDYGRYRDHMAHAHPGVEPMSREDF